MISCQTQINGTIPDMIDSSIGKSLYSLGIQDTAILEANYVFSEIVVPMRDEVKQYRSKFEQAFNDYAQENSVMSKMANTLNPTQKQRKQKISIKRNEYKNSNDSTKELIKVMDEGHSLLLSIRERLTGQKIITKFIISYNGKIYQIDEKDIKVQRILSTYGGGTISNPFSVAYELDVNLLESKEFLKKAVEISNETAWQQIYNSKSSYLAEAGEEYENIFLDSIDAEIYELIQQNQEELTLELYTQYRKDLGGGGGYASPFYKIGDIGLTQVKFFNIKDKQKKVTANYARFSLLRDRMKDLENILNLSNITEIGQELLKFFTENNKVSDSITRETNEVAKDIIRDLFNL